jgi:hypothetical protein
MAAAYSPPNLARAKIPKPVVLFHGTTHKTPASQSLVNLALGGTTRKKKMSSRVSSKTRHKRKASSSSTGKRKRLHASPVKRAKKGKLAKGSAAAKKRMAKLRSMRKSG